MKSRKSVILKIGLGLVVIIAIIVLITVKDLIWQPSVPEVSANMAETPTRSPAPSVAATPSPSVTAEPTATPIPAYIPAPDELLDFDYSALALQNDNLKYSIDYGSLTATWDIVESADYNVLYALDENDIVYYKDILWPDIESWMISHVRLGNILLLSYQDMGEAGTQDDVLIRAQNQKIVDGDNLLNSDEPLQNKYYIVIDKEDFTMAVFTYDEQGQYTNLVAAFPCAIGRSARMTALGVFEISSKGAWKRWNSTQYSPYYTKYTAGVYIHGAIYRSKNFDSLLYKSYNAIGSKSTSGCIRTTVEAAMFVYYECPAGTVIEVVSSSDLVAHVERPPLDEEYPRWDPTDPGKPETETESSSDTE